MEWSVKKIKQSRIALTRGSRRRWGQEAAHINRQASVTLPEAGLGSYNEQLCLLLLSQPEGWGLDSSLIDLPATLSTQHLVCGWCTITGEMEMNV